MNPSEVSRDDAASTISSHSGRRQQLVHFGNHRERIGHIKHVGLAARPAAIRIQTDGAAFADETPADGMRLLTVTAGAQAFRVTRCRAGLADLVQMRQKRQHGLTLAALIHERFAAAERRARLFQETKNQFFRLRQMRLSVGLFFRPARAGNE